MSENKIERTLLIRFTAGDGVRIFTQVRTTTELTRPIAALPSGLCYYETPRQRQPLSAFERAFELEHDR